MYLSCWHVCWRWKRKILAAWGQYRSFYGALEHTWNINLLTFHLQTLGTHSPFTQIPSFAFLLFGNGTKAEKNKNRAGSKKHVLWKDQLGKVEGKGVTNWCLRKAIRQFLFWSFLIVLQTAKSLQPKVSFFWAPACNWIKRKRMWKLLSRWVFQGLLRTETLFCLRNIAWIYFYWHITILCSAYDKGLGTEKIYILCEKKCFSLATTLKLKFCGISTFKAMELSTL